MPSRPRTPMMSARPYYSTGQVAKLLGVCGRTVANAIDAGRLPGVKLPGSRLRRVPHDALVRWALKNNLRPLAARLRGMDTDPVAGVQDMILALLEAPKEKP